MKKALLFFVICTVILISVPKAKAAEALTEEEKIQICKAVHSQCENEPFLTKIALTAVIINRLNSTDYPNTVGEIINETDFPNFSEESIQALTKEDLYEELLALDAVLSDGVDPTCGACVFMNGKNLQPWKINTTFQIKDFLFGYMK